MKKRVLKIVSLILTAVCLCAVCSSCLYIDELERTTAYYADGKRETVEYFGKTYKKLTNTLFEYYSDDYYSRDYGNRSSYLRSSYKDVWVRIANKDIPLLLVDNYVFQSDRVVENGEAIIVSNALYCLEGKEDVYSGEFDRTKQDHICYTIQTYDEEGCTYVPVLLNDRQMEAIQNSESVRNYSYQPYREIGLYTCTENAIFGRYYCSLYYTENDEYYLQFEGCAPFDKVTEDSPASSDDRYRLHFYKIGDQYKDDVRVIVKNYLKDYGYDVLYYAD